MDLDALKVEIATNRAQSSLHAQQRRGQRLIAWDTMRASIVRKCELVESAQGGTKVLLLSWMLDNRPLHTVWGWRDTTQPPLLITAYQPDEPPYRTQWTNGYRQRVRP
jgi:hypothetical protein